ncbi:MAG TPA: NAD(P)-dependent alcohol dehydrogenase [Aggregatilineaceae bacterium]|nr:NAD(P)-dependent alcohol dehydrogenase [Aggregatilineaceae bacterium]
MQAVVYEKYGPPEVLHLVERRQPLPKENEVLVKVHATTVTHGDVRMRSFTVPRAEWIPARLYLGIRGPRRAILGMELSGEIEAVGQAVTRFKPGDPILASTFAAGFGGYAEYKCLPEATAMILKPSPISYEEAAAVPIGGGTAVRFLRKANIQPGQKILIYGASGSVGTFAVQLAKHYGAEVYAVCSTANLELVKSLGVDCVIDYTREDVTRYPVDVVFDAVGLMNKKTLPEHGIFVSVHGSAGGEKLQDLLFLAELLASGELKPVIDRCYPLDQIVAAHRYVDTGHKKGNVIITI